MSNLVVPESEADHGLPTRVRGQLALEFGVIFLAVTLSFVAEDLREGWGERRDERVMLEAIRSDLRADFPIVRDVLELDSLAGSAGRWLHQNWDRPSLPLDSLSKALQPQYAARVYVPTRAAYESAKGAGRFDFIQNAPLRSAIGAHYETGQGEEQAVNDLVVSSLRDLDRSLRPYVKFGKAFPVACCAPVVSLDVAWSEVQRDRALRNTLMASELFRRLSEARLRSFEQDILALDSLITAEVESRWR